MAKKQITIKEIAVCGMLSALSIVIMLVGSIIQVGIFAAPVMAALSIVVIEAEYGLRTALLCYASTAAVGVFIMPDKELALFYAVFGWYPALLPKLRKINSSVLRYALEFAIYLVMILSLYGVLMKLLGLDTGINEAQFILNISMLLVGGISFLLLDFIYLRFGEMLRRRIKKMIK